MTAFKKTVLQLLHGRLEHLAMRLGFTCDRLSHLLDQDLQQQEREDILFAATDVLEPRGWNPGKYEDVLSGLAWADPVEAEKVDHVDRVGARVRSGDRSIHVGWTHSPGLAAPGSVGEPEGAAIEMTKRVLNQLSLQPSWTELPYSKLIAAVLDYRIEVVAPFLMRFPFRERQVRFSVPVFDPVPVVCIAHREATQRLFGDSFPSAERMIVVSLLGEIGNHLSERLLPGAECEDACESLEAAIETIRSAPIRAGAQPKLRVMTADFRMCTALAERYSDLTVVPHRAPPMSDTSFVVHPQELVLLNAINSSVELIKRIDAQTNDPRRRSDGARARKWNGQKRGLEKGIREASMYPFSAKLLTQLNELETSPERFAEESDLDAQSLRAWLQNGPDSRAHTEPCQLHQLVARHSCGSEGN